MKGTKMIKRVLQIGAFIIFVLQMISALSKYSAAPTMVSGGRKVMSTLDLPILVTICKTSQFDYARSPLIGYRSSTPFLTGEHNNKTIISWKGPGNMTYNETRNYLYHISAVKDVYAEYENVVTRFFVPYGICTVAEGTPSKLLSEERNRFSFYVKKGGNYVVYITDRASALHFQLQRPLTTGDKIHLDIPDNFTMRKIASYNVELTERQVTIRDGSCTKYPDEAGHASYPDCVEDENRRRILPVLGCMVPWMSDEDQCKEAIQRMPKHDDIFKWIQSIYKNTWTGNHYRFSSCPLPCTLVSAHANVLQQTTTNSKGDHRIDMYFKESVKVENVILAYNMDSLLVEIGSSLGLWLRLSVVGLFDVGLVIIHKIKQVLVG